MSSTAVPTPLPTESLMASRCLDNPPMAGQSTFVAGREEYIDIGDGGRLAFGEIVADRVTKFIGSWRFIIGYFALLICWVAVNTVAWARHWDPYPFIFLNLILSFQGAFAAPIILMSQNRQETKDRLEEQCDHAVNLQAEHAVEAMQKRIEELGCASLVEIASLRDSHQAVLSRLDELLARQARERRDTEA